MLQFNAFMYREYLKAGDDVVNRYLKYVGAASTLSSIQYVEELIATGSSEARQPWVPFVIAGLSHDHTLLTRVWPQQYHTNKGNLLFPVVCQTSHTQVITYPRIVHTIFTTVSHWVDTLPCSCSWELIDYPTGQALHGVQRRLKTL